MSQQQSSSSSSERRWLVLADEGTYGYADEALARAIGQTIGAPVVAVPAIAARPPLARTSALI